MTLKFEHCQFALNYSLEDDEWVGVCSQLPSLSYLDEDRDAALAGIKDLVKDVLEDLDESEMMTREQLMQLAERDAQLMLGLTAAEAWRLIDAQDPRIVGTIAETSMKGIRWLLNDD